MRTKPIPEAVAVCVTAMSVAVAVRGWPAASDVDIAGWFTGFATLFTGVVALLLGTTELRRNRESRRRAVTVYQWLYVMNVASARGALEDVVRFLERVQAAPVGSEFSETDQEWLRSAVEIISVPSIRAHVDSLVYMPNDCASKLACIAAHGSDIAFLLGTWRSVKNVTVELKMLAGVMLGKVRLMRELVDLVYEKMTSEDYASAVNTLKW